MPGRVLLAAFLSAAAVTGCGGGGMAKIKGKLLENGQPVTVAGQASLVFSPATPEGKAGPKAYAATLSEDGSFELFASGGEVAPGPYVVSLEVAGPKGTGGVTAGIAKYRETFKNVKQELKPGENDLTFDLAKPKG